MVLKYVKEWETTVKRLGRWVDFEHGYKTMDATFMESIWWVFKQLWLQGRIYKAHRIILQWKLKLHCQILKPTAISGTSRPGDYRPHENP